MIVATRSRPSRPLAGIQPSDVRPLSPPREDDVGSCSTSLYDDHVSRAYGADEEVVEEWRPLSPGGGGLICFLSKISVAFGGQSRHVPLFVFFA